jgi:hypothetical protein
MTKRCCPESAVYTWINIQLTYIFRQFRTGFQASAKHSSSDVTVIVISGLLPYASSWEEAMRFSGDIDRSHDGSHRLFTTIVQCRTNEWYPNDRSTSIFHGCSTYVKSSQFIENTVGNGKLAAGPSSDHLLWWHNTHVPLKDGSSQVFTLQVNQDFVMR